MSRIGRAPIAIPAGVTVTVSDDNIVTVKGPKGTLTQEVNKNITVKQEGNEIIVTRPNDEKQNRAFHGLYRALIANMVKGVTEGFKKELEVNGVGYRVQKQGKDLVMNLGYSTDYIAIIPEGLTVVADAAGKVTISGIDKQKVGEFSAQLRKLRKPEPYKGKGIRFQGEVVRKKAGKTAAK